MCKLRTSSAAGRIYAPLPSFGGMEVGLSSSLIETDLIYSAKDNQHQPLGIMLLNLILHLHWHFNEINIAGLHSIAALWITLNEIKNVFPHSVFVNVQQANFSFNQNWFYTKI